MNIKRIVSTASASFMIAALGVPAMAFAATSTVVTNDNVARQAEDSAPTKPWVVYTRTAHPGTATFRSGPSVPPLGNGSLELATSTGNDKVYAFNFDHVSAKLSDIDAMAYSTYRSSGEAQQVAALNLQVDYNGPDTAYGFTTLVFEPVYNTEQGAVVSNAWQAWDAFKGGNAVWWSSGPIPGAPNRDTFVSWNTILSENPNATILGGYGVNQGSGNPALTTAVDKLSIGLSGTTTTYDFEALAAPTITSPANNSTVTSSALTKIYWTNVTGAAAYEYRAFSDSLYTAQVYDSAPNGPLTASEIPTAGTPEGTYYVQVRAKDAAGNYSVWSNDAANPYKIIVNNTVAKTTPKYRDDCKNQGYKNYVDGNGNKFKNQGACVSYVSKPKVAHLTLNSADVQGLTVSTIKHYIYRFDVSGTWANRPGESVDAECTSWQGAKYKNAVNGGYNANLLDVQVDKSFVNWGSCANDHSYTHYVLGTGDPINLRVFDGNVATNTPDPSWYGDNNGTLNVTVTSYPKN